jgi:methanethiol S-methyltransferase
MKMGSHSALMWDAALCLAFFLQHSGMVRRSFRLWLSRWIPTHFDGMLYTIASGVFLVLLSVLWQPSGVGIFALEGLAWWLMKGLILLSCAGIVWCFRVIGDFDAFGTQAFLAHVRHEPPHVMPFIVKGPYRWVRHPVYFFGIVIILARPSLSLDGLMFDVLLTLWLVVGTILEERDLVVEFGDVYRTYQQSVPMLLPWRLPRPV